MQYVSQNTGVKENIILNSYNGKSVYEYTLDTDGLSPKISIDGKVYLFDEHYNAIFVMDKAYAVDSANNYCHDISYSLEQNENGTYTLTMTVDETYLANAVYPVTIDPEVTDSQMLTSNAFGATTYYSDGTTVTSGNTFRAGNNGAANSITHMEFTDITPFVFINPENINSAEMFIFSDSSVENKDFVVRAHNFSDGWNKTASNWEDAYSACTSYSTNLVVPTEESSSIVYLNITTLFKDWLTVQTKYYKRNDLYAMNDGFFITSNSTYNDFYTSSYSNVNNRPKIYVHYTEDYSLEEGYYHIKAGYYGGNALYLTDSGMHVPTIYQKINGDTSQIWRITKNQVEFSGGEALYFIRNVATGKYLKNTDGIGLSLVNINGDAYEGDAIAFATGYSYKIPDQSNGYRRILGDSSEYTKTLTIKDYSKADGSITQLESVSGIDSQRWQFEKVNLEIYSDDSVVNLIAGERKQIDFATIPEFTDVTWTSTNEGIAYGLSAGYIQAVGVGTATVTATISITVDGEIETRSKSWTVNVNAHAINITEPIKILSNGSKQQIQYSTNSPDSKIVWTSDNESIATVDETGQVTAVGIGKAVITATSLTGATSTCNVYCDRYYYELINTFGFEPEAAFLIRDLYNRVVANCDDLSSLEQNWQTTRLLSSFVYDGAAWDKLADTVGNSDTIEDYVEVVLGYTNREYEIIKTSIKEQYNNCKAMAIPDFAHMCYALSARLYYQLVKTGERPSDLNRLTGKYTSCIGGWLGDAVISENGSPSFGNDDYCADLDAENIYRILLTEDSFIDAVNTYYSSLSNTNNRAMIFQAYIPYDVIQGMIFNILVDNGLKLAFVDIFDVNSYELSHAESYYWNVLETNYHDTYDFLNSIRNNLSEIGHF